MSQSTRHNKNPKLERSWIEGSTSSYRLRHFLMLHKPLVVFLMETKVDDKRTESICWKLSYVNGFDMSADGSKDGLCLAWKEEVIVSLRSFSLNHIDSIIQMLVKDVGWRFTSFYGSPFVNTKRDSWESLRRLGQDNSIPWCVCVCVCVWRLYRNYICF